MTTPITFDSVQLAPDAIARRPVSENRGDVIGMPPRSLWPPCNVGQHPTSTLLAGLRTLLTGTHLCRSGRRRCARRSSAPTVFRRR